jgi:D-alanyl-D-alanine carboxypeptidase/D-alanyl-D-alanine-endopeptidase (penicillin-binding protein 4)
VPRTARALASRRSAPVGVLVREMSKTSNNFMAEALLKTMGAESAGPPGTWDKGLRAVKQRLAELGIPESSYDYKNGSGLYSSAFMSAETMTRLLVAAARDFRYGPDFVAALAVAGADGTLGHRMAGGPAERYVRGKSGSLRGVACLSGFAGGVGRPLLAFSVLVNDIPDTPAGARAARSLADEVAETLVRYVEAD